MKKLYKAVFFILFSAIVLTGCSEGDERRHPLYIKALQDRQSGNGKDAADKLCELLKRRPHSIHTHRLLATVYDEMLNDPAMAVYHYKAYLQAMPDAVDSVEVKAWLEQAEKRSYTLLHQRFGKTGDLIVTPAEEPAETSPGEPGPGKSEAIDTTEKAEQTPEKSANSLETEKQLQAQVAAKDAEIAELKLKIAQYKVRHKAMRQEVEKMRKLKQAQKAAALPDKIGNKNAPRQYKVVSGDTPGSIARKVYGKSSLYNIILRANPRVDARQLRPGMVLNIPELSEK